MSCELTIKYKFWAPGMDTPEDLQLSITQAPGPVTRQEIDFYTSDKHGHAEWNAYDVTIQSVVGEPIELKIESPRLVDNGDDTYTYKGTVNLPKLDDTCAMCLPKTRKLIELYNIDKYQPYFHAPLVDRVEGDAQEIILSADGRERSASYNQPGSMTVNAAGGVWTRFDKVVKLEQQIHQIVDASADVSTYNFDVTTSCSETSNPGTNPGTEGYNNSKSMDFRRENVGYMRCGDVDTFNNATEFSVSFWCLSLDRDDSNGNRCIFCVGDADNSIRVMRGNNDEIRLAIHVGTSGSIFASTGSQNPILMSEWNHVVVSYKIDPSIGDGQGVGKVYINGELKVENNTFAKIDETTFTGEFNIGRLRWLNNQYWAGLIDELAIWNVELQSDDVTTLYNNGTGTTDIGSLPGLTHWWRMEEGDGATVVNSAAPGVNDATIVNVTPHNSLKFSDNVPELQPWNDNNYSVKFTGGAGDYLTTDFLTSEYNIKDKFTLSLWVKLDNTEGTQDFIGRYIGNGDRWYFGISGSKIRVGVGKNFDVSTHEHGIVAGEWTHVAFTWDGGYAGTNKLKYYRDGEFVGELTFAWSNDDLASTHLPYIGALNSDGTANYQLSGLLDELAVFGYTMTDSDVRDIYNNGIATDIKSSKPVAWWRMGDNDNGTGTVVTDVGLGSNHATMNGDVSFVSDVPAVWNGNINSVDLDGSNDYIDCGGDADFSFTDGAGNDSAFSVSAWVKLDANTRARVVSKGNMEWLFGTNGNRRFSLHLFSDDNNSAYIGQIEGSSLPTGVWHHLVATYDGSNSSTGIKLYRAGSSVGMGGIAAGTYAGMASQQGALRIGQWPGDSTAMDGLVDEVAVFDYELTPSQVSDIYNNGKPADISSLSPLGWWRMGDNNNGTGTVITDVGSGGNDGTIVGDATFSTDTLRSIIYKPNNYAAHFPVNGNNHLQTEYVTPATTAISYSFWIKTSNTSDPMTLGPSDAAENSGVGSFRLLTTGDGQKYYLIVDDGTGYYLNNELPSSTTGDYNIRDGMWHHMVITMNGTSFKAYIDGGDAAINAGNTSNNIGAAFTATSSKSYAGGSQTFKIGRNGQNLNYYYKGLMDEVAIFEYEITAEQAREIYNNGSPDDLSSYVPAGWWRMGDNNNGTGTVVTDAGSGGNDATIVGSVTFSTDIPKHPLVLPYITNTHAVHFNGNGGFMDFGTDINADKTKPFSISVWFNADDLQEYPILCSLKTGGDNGFVVGLAEKVEDPNRIYNGVWFGSAPTNDTNQFKGFATANDDLATALETGWHHLVLTYDGVDHQAASSITVYIDGVEYTTDQPVGLTTYPNVNQLAKSDNKDGYFDGRIDEFAVFDYKLSRHQVTGIYNNGAPSDLEDLEPTGWWRMGDDDDGTGNIITNKGSGDSQGTLVGGSVFSTDVLQGDDTSDDEDTTSTGDSKSSDPYDPYVSGNSCAYVFIDYKNRPLVNNPALLAQVNDTLIFDRVTHDNHGLTESSFMRMKIDDLNTGETVAEQNQDSTDWQMSWTPGTAGLYQYSSQDSNPSAGGEILVTDNGESVIYIFNKKQFRSARGQVNVKIAGQSESMYMTTDFRLIQWTDSQDTTDVALDHGTFLTTDNSNSTTTLGTYVSQDHIYITIRNMSQQAVISGDVTLLS